MYAVKLIKDICVTWSIVIERIEILIKKRNRKYSLGVSDPFADRVCLLLLLFLLVKEPIMLYQHASIKNNIYAIQTPGLGHSVVSEPLPQAVIRHDPI